MINIIKFKKCSFIIIVIFAFNACNNDIKREKLQLPQNVVTDKDKFSIVFYHHGECSFCYGVLADLPISFPKAAIISITTLKDTNLLNYHLKEISFKGISYIDSSGQFHKKNQKMLYNANLFLINSHHEILGSWLDYDLKIKESLKNIIYE